MRDAIARLTEVETWEDDKLWAEVAQGLPNYRLSKFQPLMPPWVEREMLAAYLLDVEGAWRWLAAGEDVAGPGRLPEALLRAVQSAVAPEPVDEDEGEPLVQPTLPVRWVDTDQDLAAVCADLRAELVLGLDVETTLRTRALCTVQLAGSMFVTVIDALAVTDLEPLRALLEGAGRTILVHNASFERSVLTNHGIQLRDFVDTMLLSRRARSDESQHSLKAVCRRELGIELDKAMQTSDWTRRPLTRRQLAYAAVDAEVLRQLHLTLS